MPLPPLRKGRRKRMRRILLLVGLTALLLTVAAGIAAANHVEVADVNKKQCNNNPCYGTDGRDYMNERKGSVSDRMFGLAGNDVIDAVAYNNDGDLAKGGKGRDTLWLNDGDGQDRARGGAGRDVCYIDPGDTARSCIVRGETDPASVGTAPAE